MIENKNRYYFDWAATALQDAPPACGNTENSLFGNPSSLHSEGRQAKSALEDARNRCAKVLNVPPDTLYFTSGGTEANCIALFSNFLRKGQGRVICPKTEHPSIREGMEVLEKMGKPIGFIGVDSEGRVTPSSIAAALEKYPDTRFAAIMSVNNETGTITNIAEIANVIRSKNNAPIHLHCDIVQAIGKIPVDITGWDIDSGAVSGHKIGAPRGIGLLYLRRSIDVMCIGGGQERKIRGGTENVKGAIALADCLERTISADNESAKKRWKKLIDKLASINRCTIIPSARLKNMDAFSPYILQAAFKDIPGEVMARALDDLGFAVSTGSACSAASPERPVLAAMGIEERLRLEGIRISQGYTTTDEEIDLLIEAIAEVLKFL